MADSELTVSLAEDSPSGRAFLADICSMLTAIASRAGHVLNLAPSDTDSLVCRGSLPRSQIQAMVDEAGVHRAQIVPTGSASGRIETVKVFVEMAGEPSSSLPGILKTYNYPLGWVTQHSTGERVRLSTILKGDPVSQ